MYHTKYGQSNLIRRPEMRTRIPWVSTRIDYLFIIIFFFRLHSLLADRVTVYIIISISHTAAAAAADLLAGDFDVPLSGARTRSPSCGRADGGGGPRHWGLPLRVQHTSRARSFVRVHRNTMMSGCPAGARTEPSSGAQVRVFAERPRGKIVTTRARRKIIRRARLPCGTRVRRAR